MKNEVTPKDKVFQTAARLFYQHGYRAIGVDIIAAESGVGKMTLYRHYASKDGLIAAYLKDSDDVFWDYFERATKDVPTARGKLLAFFQSLQEYVTTPVCYGCPFLHVASEYPETDYPGHQIALEHKQSVREQFRQLANEAGATNPEELADQLFLLMDGAYMAARMFGVSNPAASVAQAAETLIEAQLSSK